MKNEFSLDKLHKNCIFAQKLGVEKNRGNLLAPSILNALNFYSYKSNMSITDVAKALNFEYELNKDELASISNSFNEYIKQDNIPELTCDDIARFTNGKLCQNCRLQGCLESHSNFYISKDSCSLNETAIPSLDLENIPNTFLRELVKNIQANINCPIEYVVISAITILGAALGINYYLSLSETWHIYSSILSVLIGEPSSKKSPAMKAILEPLQKAEEQANINISVSNTTVEGVCKFLSESKKSVLIACDELKGWLNSLGEYKGKTSSDRQFYLSAWNCDKYVVLRKTSATLTIPKTHVSLIGSIQPNILKDMFKYLQTGDGFVERLIWIIPSDYKDIGKYINRGLEKLDKEKYSRFEGIVREILISKGNKEYFLSPADEKLLDDFNNEIKQELKKNPDIASLYGKATQLVGKLALIYQVFGDVDSRKYDNNIISEDVLKGSIELTKYFIKQYTAVVRIFGTGNRAGNTENIEDIVYSWLLNRHDEFIEGFTPSNISTYKVAKLYKADEAKNILDSLIEKGRVAYNSIKRKYFLIIE